MIPPETPTFQMDQNGQFVLPSTTIDQPVKKKRGRPPGAKNKNKAGSTGPDARGVFHPKKQISGERLPPHRPKNYIDWKLFEKLCGCQCTQSEMASMLNVHEETLRRRVEQFYKDSYAGIYKKFSEDGKCSLRRNQFVLSQKNAGMAIWLGKIWLGQQDPDKINDLQRAQLDYATQAILHAEQNLENLSTFAKAAASLPGVNSADQHMAGSSEVRKDVQLNPEDDKAPEGRTERGCVDCWSDAGLDST